MARQYRVECAFADEVAIDNCMALPSLTTVGPGIGVPRLTRGTTAAQSKRNFIEWTDELVSMVCTEHCKIYTVSGERDWGNKKQRNNKKQRHLERHAHSTYNSHRNGPINMPSWLTLPLPAPIIIIKAPQEKLLDTISLVHLCTLLIFPSILVNSTCDKFEKVPQSLSPDTV